MGPEFLSVSVDAVVLVDGAERSQHPMSETERAANHIQVLNDPQACVIRRRRSRMVRENGRGE